MVTMEHSNSAKHEIRFNFGTFQGFNFKTQSPICQRLSAKEVLNWNHNVNGEAEFYPSGDRSEISLVFKGQNSVCASELVELDKLLENLGTDSKENFIRIYYALNVHGERLDALSADSIQDLNLHIFYGTSTLDLRREAAFELFRLYHPKDYEVWEKSTCDGLIFDPDRFLNSPVFYTEEIQITDEAVLIVAPN